MSRSKGTTGSAIKEHARLTAEGASIGEHVKLAELGAYYETISEVTLSILAHAAWIKKAQEDAEILNPDDTKSGIFDARGVEELNRRAADLGLILANILTSENNSEIVSDLAAQIATAQRLGLRIEEHPVSKLPSVREFFQDKDGKSKAVRSDVIRTYVDSLRIPIPKDRLLNPRHVAHAAIALYVKAVMRREPAHTFNFEELLAAAAHLKRDPKTIRRAIADLGIQMRSRWSA